MKICRFKFCNEEVKDCSHNQLICNECKNKMMKIKRPSCDSVGSWFGKIANKAKDRAKVKGVPYNITKQDVYDVWPQDGMCSFFPIKMDASQPTTWQSPALDRIDPSKGYVPGNIRLISGAANNMKGDMPEETFQELMKGFVSPLHYLATCKGGDGASCGSCECDPQECSKENCNG